jgi:hypothetical protein
MSASVGVRAGCDLIGSATALDHCGYFFGGAGAGATADVVTPSEVADAAADAPGDAEASAAGAPLEDADADAEALDAVAAFLADFVTCETRRP